MKDKNRSNNFFFRFVFFSVLGLGYSSSALGDDAPQKPERPPGLHMCASEREKFCPMEKDPGRLGKCLASHRNELSIKCRQGFERFLQLREDAASLGGGALSSFGGPNALGPPIPIISYDGRYSGASDGIRINEHAASISAPVYKGEKDSLTLSAAGSQLNIDKKLTLSSGIEIPKTLSRVEVGAQYKHALPDKRNWGLRASVGTSGDKLFQSNKDMSYSLGASYGFPAESENGYWMATVSVTNNGGFLNYIPIPGIVYFYKTPTFTGMFGFPVVSIQWSPVNPWAYSLSIFGTTVQAEIAYGRRDRFQIFAGYDFMQQSYMTSERTEDRDRLTLQEQKAMVGFRTSLMRGMMLETQGGKNFERSIYMGNGLFNQDRGSTELPDDWVVNVGLKYAF